MYRLILNTILQGLVKLAKYGLYHMTGYGTDVAFPIGSVQLFFVTVLSFVTMDMKFGITNYMLQRHFVVVQRVAWCGVVMTSYLMMSRAHSLLRAT